MTNRDHSATRERFTEYIGVKIPESLEERLSEYEDLQGEDTNRSDAVRELLDLALEDELPPDR